MALRVRVCRISEVVANELRAFAVRGVTWPVIVSIVDGVMIAVPGVCPHEDVALWEGDLRGSTIVCPGHGWGFDVHTGACSASPGIELRRYPITLVEDEVWVDLL
ncbi:MAG: Rieske 2Fe-2S domain-containing protein [Deltaproteobacteria bacterium]|nr:Rieske 2Fe-2S domain-containing protein [Deltaproteobacteria bacterium]